MKLKISAFILLIAIAFILPTSICVGEEPLPKLGEVFRAKLVERIEKSDKNKIAIVVQFESEKKPNSYFGIGNRDKVMDAWKKDNEEVVSLMSYAEKFGWVKDVRYISPTGLVAGNFSPTFILLLEDFPKVQIVVEDTPIKVN